MRKGLWVLFASVMVVGGGLFWGYQHYFHREVTEKDIHVEEGFFDFTEIVDGTAALEDLNLQKDPAPAGETEKSVPGQASSGPNATEPVRPSGPNQGNGAVSVESIRAKYYPKFKQLETAALARLDQLARNALADYRQSQKTGQPSLSDLASLYISAANKLQDGVNRAFYRLLDQMEAELEGAGLPTDLVREAEATYKNAVERKKNELLSYALKVKNGGN